MRRWGWLEWFLLSQVVIAALVFVPGISFAGMGLLRHAMRSHRALFWLLIVRFGSASRGALLSAAPLAPPLRRLAVSVDPSPRHQLARLGSGPGRPLCLGLVARILGSLGVGVEPPDQPADGDPVPLQCVRVGFGIAQVYRPLTFNPPYIPAMHGTFEGEHLMYQAEDGRKIMRPCGLTDTPWGCCAGRCRRGADGTLLGTPTDLLVEAAGQPRARVYAVSR